MSESKHDGVTDQPETISEEEPEQLHRAYGAEPVTAIRATPHDPERLVRRRTILGFVTAGAGVVLYSFSTVLAFAISRSGWGYEVSEIINSRLGILMMAFGFLGPGLANYLQYGAIFPTQRDVIEKDDLRLPQIVASGSGNTTTIMIADPTKTYSHKEGSGAHIIAILSRLNSEISELGRRGNINLIIGIFTTIVGVSILIYVVYGTVGDMEEFGWRSAIHTLLRVSIALFIQTFAYFFLRLYKTSLEDIKYYQNEITNVESRWLAFETAKELKNDALMKLTIESLMKTERNFILKKGDSTIGLERERLDKNEVIELVKEALGAAVKMKPSK